MVEGRLKMAQEQQKRYGGLQFVFHGQGGPQPGVIDGTKPREMPMGTKKHQIKKLNKKNTADNTIKCS